MPTIFEAKLDGSNAVRYFHISIVNFYFNAALNYASEAQEQIDSEISLRKAICAIIFSAMTLESFINERADDLYSDKEKKDFDAMRRKYEKRSSNSSISHKLKILARSKFALELPADLIESIESLASIRNTLIHYQPTDTAGKYIMPPPSRLPAENGGGMVVFDFMQKPIKIDPPFLQKINNASAANSYNTALATLKFWHACEGRDCGLEAYPILTLNQSSTNTAS